MPNLSQRSSKRSFVELLLWLITQNNVKNNDTWRKNTEVSGADDEFKVS